LWFVILKLISCPSSTILPKTIKLQKTQNLNHNNLGVFENL
jgi:hypothetical protein